MVPRRLLPNQIGSRLIARVDLFFWIIRGNKYYVFGGGACFVSDCLVGNGRFRDCSFIGQWSWQRLRPRQSLATSNTSSTRTAATVALATSCLYGSFRPARQQVRSVDTGGTLSFFLGGIGSETSIEPGSLHTRVESHQLTSILTSTLVVDADCAGAGARHRAGSQTSYVSLKDAMIRRFSPADETGIEM